MQNVIKYPLIIDVYKKHRLDIPLLLTEKLPIIEKYICMCTHKNVSINL